MLHHLVRQFRQPSRRPDAPRTRNQPSSAPPRSGIASLFAALALVGFVSAGYGFEAVFTVNSTVDLPDTNVADGVCDAGGGVCTLRAAIQQANQLTGFNTTIHVPAGIYILTITGASEDYAASGDLDIRTSSNAVTIDGAGPAATIINGGGLDRVFHILGTGNVTLSNLTVRNGRAAGITPHGGGILNNGLLTLTHMTLSDNSAESCGGGVYNTNVLTVTGSTISANIATNMSYTVADGGGIWNSGTVTLTNTTVSGNTAAERGGGLYNAEAATATLNNVTITANAAVGASSSGASGGGIWNSPSPGGGIVNIANTLVAYNNDSGESFGAPDCYATDPPLNSGGYNLIGSTSGCAMTSNRNDITGVDPLVSSLQDNGGGTATVALQSGSPAIDAGSPDLPGSSGACAATDQRAVSRPMDGDGNGVERCDIGALERVPVVNLSISNSDSPDPVTIGGTLTYAILITNNSTIPAIGVELTDVLPSGVTLGSAQGCSEVAGTVTCSMGDIAAGGSAGRSIVVTPTASASNPFANTATITGGHFNNIGQTQATSSTAISSADVSATMTDAPDPLNKGDLLTFTVNVSNAGPATATGVTITYPVAPNVMFVAVTPTQGSCGVANGTLTCNLGDMLRLGTARVDIFVRPTTRGTLYTTVTAGATSHDPNAANNYGMSQTTVLSVPFVVDSTADLPDAIPGDDVCSSAQGCTLRAAIMEANASSGPDTIVLPAGTYTLSIPGTGEDSGATGDLDVTGPLTISGGGAKTTIIDANRIDRVMTALADLTISGVTIRNGDAGCAQGGGILNLSTMTLREVVISGNHAAVGGGLANVAPAQASVTSTTVMGNFAGEMTCSVTKGGAGIYSSGQLNLLNTTISGNTAVASFAGGMWLTGNGRLVSVTVADNAASIDAGGIRSVDGFDGNVVDTILSNNTPNNCHGQLQGWYSLDSDNTCLFYDSLWGNQINVDPMLGLLQDNGGPTPTHALLFGSPAIDAGSAYTDTPATDQRGVARTSDGNGDGAAVIDIGAFEALYPPPQITSISPNEGLVAGGQTATVTGSYLAGGTVKIGGIDATVTNATPTMVTFTTPAHAAGTVDVSVTAIGGTTTSPGGYTYFALSTPGSFSAAATSSSQVSLVWSTVAGATGYEVWRTPSLSAPWVLATSGAGNVASDSGLTPDTTYLYKVRAIGSGTSAFTPIDAATTVVFTDDNPAGIIVKAAHVLEIRTAVSAMRLAAGLTSPRFATLAAGDIIRAQDITDLRAILQSAREKLGLPTIVYTDPTITVGVTPLKALHVTELRAGTQ